MDKLAVLTHPSSRSWYPSGGWRCTLSADHRAVDGALAARWLRAFKTAIENPLSILV